MATPSTVAVVQSDESSNGFIDYLSSKGMDKNVARRISEELELTCKTQLRFVTHRMIQDIREE